MKMTYIDNSDGFVSAVFGALAALTVMTLLAGFVSLAVESCQRTNAPKTAEGGGK
jgi:hypothetical protein